MRYLNNKDLFKIMRIVRKANIKQKLLDMDLPRDENGKLAISEDEYGIMMMLEVFEGIPEVEKEVFELLEEHEPNWYLRGHYNRMTKALAKAEGGE